MDVATGAALIGGGFGTVGAVLKLWEVFISSKANQKPAEGKNENDRDSRVDQNIWKLMDRLEHERDQAQNERNDAKKDAARISMQLEKLESMYQLLLEEMEELKAARVKDQAYIMELETSVKRLEAKS